MKSFFVILLSIAYAISLVYIRHYTEPKGAKLVGMVGFVAAYLSLVRYRVPVTNFFSKIPLNSIALYFITALPFMLFEENINCLSSGCQIIPRTLPFLYISLLIPIFLIKVVKIRKLWKVISIYSVIGLLFEILFGDGSVQFQALPPVFFILISIWTWISYAFYSIVPAAILLNDDEQPK